MILRRAEKADIEKVCENRFEFVKTIGEIGSPEKFLECSRSYYSKHIDDGTLIVWIAEDCEEIVAIVIICTYEVLPTIKNMSGKTGLILNVSTKENYRRQGLARSLLTNAMDDAKIIGVEKVFLKATEQGRLVYEKLGFTDIDGEMELIL